MAGTIHVTRTPIFGNGCPMGSHGTGEQLSPRPVRPRKTGRDPDSYLGYPAGPRPVPNRSRLLKPLFYVLFTRFPFLINRIINRKKEYLYPELY
jgi:hypothetical protein